MAELTDRPDLRFSTAQFRQFSSSEFEPMTGHESLRRPQSHFYCARHKRQRGGTGRSWPWMRVATQLVGAFADFEPRAVIISA